jgi:hypothetical protein
VSARIDLVDPPDVPITPAPGTNPTATIHVATAGRAKGRR